MPLTTSLATKKCSLHRPLLTFQPKVNCCSSCKQSSHCFEPCDKIHSNVSTYISRFVQGFRRRRGYILAPERNPDLQGSCSIAHHCSLLVRSEQNSSKLWHTAHDVCKRPSATSRIHRVTRLQGIQHGRVNETPSLLRMCVQVALPPLILRFYCSTLDYHPWVMLCYVWLSLPVKW
jgi:hypothetical protein